jgi:hypothetical protein
MQNATATADTRVPDPERAVVDSRQGDEQDECQAA